MPGFFPQISSNNQKMQETPKITSHTASMFRLPRFWAAEQWAVFGYVITLLSLGGNPTFTLLENIAGVIFAVVVGAKLILSRSVKLPWSITVALGLAFVSLAVFYVLIEGLGIYWTNDFAVRRLLTLVMTFILGYLVFFTVHKFQTVEPIAIAIAMGIVINLALILGSHEGVPVRAGGGLGQANLLAVSLAFGVAIMLIAANQRLRGGDSGYIPFGLFLVSGVAFYITVFHSGSRTGMVAMGLVTLAFLVIIFAKSSHYMKWLIVLMGFAGAVYGSRFISVALESIWVRRLSNLLLVYRGEGLEVRETSVFVRMEMTQAALSGWWEKPFLGHGFDSFQAVAGWGTYSHSNFAELLHNHGLLGFGLFYVMVLSLISLKGKSFLDILAHNIGVVTVFVVSVGSVIYYSKMFWILVGAMAAVCIISASERSKSGKRRS